MVFSFNFRKIITKKTAHFLPQQLNSNGAMYNTVVSMKVTNEWSKQHDDWRE